MQMQNQKTCKSDAHTLTHKSAINSQKRQFKLFSGCKI